MAPIPESAMDEFITECEELMERSSDLLQSLEKDGYNAEKVNSVYRDIHTIKGSAQLFGFQLMGKVAHAMEACLDPLRNTMFELDSNLTDALLKGLDMMGTILGEVKSGKGDSKFERTVDNFVAKILAHTLVRLGGAWDLVSSVRFKKVNSQAKEEKVGLDSTSSNLKAAAVNTHIGDQTSDQVTNEESSEVTQESSEKNKWADVEVEGLHLFDDEPSPSKDSDASSEKDIPEQIDQTSAERGNPLSEIKTGSGSKLDEKAPGLSKSPSSGDRQTPSGNVDPTGKDTSTIRVNVSLLDNLMNLIGELVLIRNQVLQHAGGNDDQDFIKLSQRLNVVTSELQNDVMKTRMQPIGNILSKFKRVVRDLSKELGKKVELHTEGDETELDKNLIEAVKDPLTHLVRNGVDHAIEMPEERVNAGKDARGSIHIKAYHEGGQVVVEVKDDGKGLDKQAIVSKALERGVVSEDAVHTMTDREIHHLLFTPGFSTAKKVSNISGRGVGLDVVKTNIEKIGGIVDLHSVYGKETTFKLKIPLTLAIVPALIVRSGAERFAIPQVKVVELVRADSDDEEKFDANKVEYLQGKPVYRLRGNLLPLIDLRKKLDLGGESEEEGQVQAGANLVFLSSEDSFFGIMVDDIEDSADIVVKPLNQFLKKLNLYSGATIMGDGDVVLILDVAGVGAAESSGELDDRQSAGLSKTVSKDVLIETSEYILVDLGCKSQFALPLVLVHRLEEFSEEDIEWSGEQPLVRYRSGILPLVNINKEINLETEKDSDEGSFCVVVVRKGERNFGFMVREILDVVNVANQIDDSLKDRAGVLGNLLYEEEVLVVLDPLEIIDQIQERFVFANSAEAGKTEDKNRMKALRSNHLIVLAEDSTFFRNQMVKSLTSEGYKVKSFLNGEQALQFLLESAPDSISCVVSDIEMPVMGGLELVETWKSERPDSQLGYVAVTTRFSESDRERGKEAGFDIYLEKLNAYDLLNAVDRLIGIDKEGGSSGNKLSA